MGNTLRALCTPSPSNEVERVYYLPLSTQLAVIPNPVLLEFRDIVVTHDSTPERFIRALSLSLEGHGEAASPILKAHPDLVPSLCLDDFDNDLMGQLNDILRRSHAPKEIINKIQLFTANKHFIFTLPTSNNGLIFQQTHGHLIKSITISYIISPQLLPAIYSLLYDFFKNVKGFALDCTRKPRHNFPDPYHIRNAAFTNRPTTYRLAFKAHCLRRCPQQDIACITKLCAKLIKSSVNLKYLNLDFNRFEITAALYQELKLSNWFLPHLNASKLKSLVLSHTLVDFEDQKLGVTPYVNRVTEFLSRLSDSLQNLHLRCSWKDSDDRRGSVPKIPRMNQVTKLSIKSDEPLTTAFTMLQSFPKLKTLVLICGTEHDWKTCSCNKREMIPPIFYATPAIKCPMVTMLAVERSIVQQPLQWIYGITQTFPNLLSLNFSITIPIFGRSAARIEQAEFIGSVAYLLYRLTNLQVLRIVVRAAEILQFGDPGDQASLFHAFKAFLKLESLRHLVIDFGPEEEQHVPPYLDEFLHRENVSRFQTRVEIARTPESSVVRDFPHIAYCRKIYCDLSLGYLRSNDS